VRYVAINAAQQEYAVVFPEYYFGQIFEAKHEPGTVAYSRGLQLQLLQETTDEMARNGCKKIIIVNGHGGNNSLLPYFSQSQLEMPHDYVVYVQSIARSAPGEPAHKSDRSTDMHAGESETSVTMIARPDLVHLDRARQESGADQGRLQGLPEGRYTGSWRGRATRSSCRAPCSGPARCSRSPRVIRSFSTTCSAAAAPTPPVRPASRWTRSCTTSKRCGSSSGWRR